MSVLLIMTPLCRYASPTISEHVGGEETTPHVSIPPAVPVNVASAAVAEQRSVGVDSSAGLGDQTPHHRKSNDTVVHHSAAADSWVCVVLWALLSEAPACIMRVRPMESTCLCAPVRRCVLLRMCAPHSKPLMHEILGKKYWGREGTQVFPTGVVADCYRGLSQQPQTNVMGYRARSRS